ncbi:pleD [Symbiodinium sp. CCMP2592]|nr:pleD [Symbiodinium sp. CCMP2592]
MEVDIDAGEEDFFGCEALRKQISEFNPFEPEEDAFAAMYDWKTPPPSPVSAKGSA